MSTKPVLIKTPVVMLLSECCRVFSRLSSVTDGIVVGGIPWVLAIEAPHGEKMIPRTFFCVGQICHWASGVSCHTPSKMQNAMPQ